MFDTIHTNYSWQWLLVLLVIVTLWSEHWQLQRSIVTLFRFTFKCLAPVHGLTLQEKASRSFFCLWGPSPEDNDITQAFPSILDYCKRSKTRRWKGLGTRLNLTKKRDYVLSPRSTTVPFLLHSFVPSWCKVGVGVTNLCSCSIPVVVSSHDCSCSL